MTHRSPLPHRVVWRYPNRASYTCLSDMEFEYFTTPQVNMLMGKFATQRLWCQGPLRRRHDRIGYDDDDTACFSVCLFSFPQLSILRPSSPSGGIRSDAYNYAEWACQVGDDRWSYKGLLACFQRTECQFGTKCRSGTVRP